VDTVKGVVDNAGFEVVGAANADDALGALENRTDIRVVFVDIHMSAVIGLPSRFMTSGRVKAELRFSRSEFWIEQDLALGRTRYEADRDGLPEAVTDPKCRSWRGSNPKFPQ
jgi:hypothetical protein